MLPISYFRGAKKHAASEADIAPSFARGRRLQWRRHQNAGTRKSG